jgi:hypothetical protein
VVATKGNGDGSAVDNLCRRWEGVRRSGRRMKQRWRLLTVDEVNGGFVGATLKTNTSAVDSDMPENRGAALR